MDWSKHSSRSQGIGLVEVLVGIIIISILLIIAVPNFLSLDHNKEIEHTKSQLLADLNVAKARASQMNQNVSLCARSNATDLSCNSTANWQYGWLIMDATNSVLAVSDLRDGAVQISSSANKVEFTPQGTALDAVSITVSASHCSGKHIYTLNINKNGLLSSTTSDCP